MYLNGLQQTVNAKIIRSKNQILHKISTKAGQSGSPIILVKNNSLSVIGIHKGGIKTVV